jgi:hypothetical protein
MLPEVLGGWIEVAGRVVETSEEFDKMALCWSLHARRDPGLEHCIAKTTS